MTLLKKTNQMVSQTLFLDKSEERHSVPIEPKPTQAILTTRTVDSQQLLNKDGKVEILHRGEIYQLKQTRSGKLILTK